MNFKDWMKLEDNGKTVTLVHPKGHKMTIYSYALPKIQREALRRLKMADGGKVPVPPKDDQQNTDQQNRAKQMVQGAENSGGMPDLSTIGDRIKNAWSKGGKIPSNDHLDSPQQGRDVKNKDMAMAKEEAKGRMEMEKTVKPKMKGLAEGGPPEQAPIIDPTQNVPVTQPPGPNFEAPGLQGQAQATLDSVNQGNAAIENQKAVDIAKAKAAAPAMEQNIQGQEAVQQAQANAYKEIKDHSDDFAAYVNNNPIDPKHYQENMGTGQKVSTAIGLFLGGMGVPFGGHNYAFDYLNKQIDRDIDAQKQRTENQKSVLGAYERLYGESNISTNLAKASMQDIYAKKIEMAALKLGTPEAIAKAQAAKAALGQSSEQLRMNAAGLLGGQRATGQAPQNHPPVPGDSGQGEKPQEKSPGTVSLLNPNASGLVMTAAKYNPMYKERAGELHKQLEQAQRLEKVLNGPDNNGKGGLKELFTNMYKDVGAGETGNSWSHGGSKNFMEHVRRNGEEALNRIPYVGPAVSGAIDIVPKSSEYQQYESSSDALKTDLSTALAGLMAPTDITKLIDSNKPQYKDSPEDVARKYKSVENTLRKTAVFPDLERIGAIHKKK